MYKINIRKKLFKYLPTYLQKCNNLSLYFRTIIKHEYYIINIFCNINNYLLFALMDSWTSEGSNKPTGTDISPSLISAKVTSSTPPNEFTPNKDEILPRPNSVLFE